MKQSYIFFALLVWQLASASAFAQWFTLSSGTTLQLEAVFFINASTGYVVGESGIIRKTSDGGSTWSPLVSPITGNWLHGLYYPSSGTGFAVGSSAISARGIIRRGVNDVWNTVYTGPDGSYYDFLSVHFADSYNGWVVGVNGKIIRTADQGVSWSPQTSGITDGLTSVCAIDMDNVVAVGYNGRILRTTTGGTSWSAISSGTAANLYSVHFTSASTGYICGGLSTNIVLKTTNGGINWTLTTLPGAGGLRSIYFPTPSTGYAVGNLSTIYKTVDGGVSWVLQSSPISNPEFRDVHFIGADTGYAVGESGSLIKTTNGGGPPVGVENISGKIPEKFELSQNYPNPFNPTTQIAYAVPKASFVRLTVYNVLGQEVATLVNAEQEVGHVTAVWDGHNSAGQAVGSGLYFYRIEAKPKNKEDAFVDVKKMLMIK
jgi:photosystem II stability/assembly factor-like uncharacterized protein